MTKWEYMVDWIGSPDTQQGGHFTVLGRLVEKGEHGWELITVLDGYGIFKRPANCCVEYVGKPCDELSVEDVTECCDAEEAIR